MLTADLLDRCHCYAVASGSTMTMNVSAGIPFHWNRNSGPNFLFTCEGSIRKLVLLCCATAQEPTMIPKSARGKIRLCQFHAFCCESLETLEHFQLLNARRIRNQQYTKKDVEVCILPVIYFYDRTILQAASQVPAWINETICFVCSWRSSNAMPSNGPKTCSLFGSLKDNV